MADNENQQIIVIEQDEQPDMEGVRDSIMKLLDEGVTVQVIAARLSLDPSKVLAVSDEARALQRQQTDNGQRLVNHLNKLDEITELAYWQCKAEPHPNNVYAYTAALELVRGIIQDLDARRDNSKLTEELYRKVLEPMFTEVMIGMTQTLAAAKIDTCSVLPPEYHGAVVDQLETVLRALAASIQDQLTGAKAAIGRVLNDVKVDTKPTQSQRRPSKSTGR